MILNSTLIRKLFTQGNEKEYCPYKVYRMNVIQDVDYRTHAMQQGAFFETLCLGSGRDGERVTDLPRRRNGQKRITQVRIEKQSREFKRLCHLYQIFIAEENTQVFIKKKLADNVYLTGHLDIYPVGLLDPEIGYTMAVVDLKLTKTIHNTWGEYCYATPELLDDIQAQIYLLLIEDIDFDLNPHLEHEVFKIASKHGKNSQFYWWVFDYKPVSENTFIRAEKSDLKRREVIETLRKAYKIVKYHEENGWNTSPSEERCKDCPLRDVCPDNFFKL